MKTTYDFCFDAVIRIILHSEDHSELQVINLSTSSLLHRSILKESLIPSLLIGQNATECLAAFISSGRQELLSWSGDPGVTMRSLLDAASRYNSSLTFLFGFISRPSKAEGTLFCVFFLRFCISEFVGNTVMNDESMTNTYACEKKISDEFFCIYIYSPQKI